MAENSRNPYEENEKRLVLVADDEEINRELLGMVLSSVYDVIFAADGREALDTIKEKKDILSLVLLDLNMPRLPGIEVLKQMKDDPDLRNIPVIVATADQKSEVESLGLGAVDFIPKPFPIADVIRARAQRTIELYEDRDMIAHTERDPLTGLYNRDYFYRHAVLFDQRHQDISTDALIVDINHFRTINERFGTKYGDEMLRKIGASIRGIVGDDGGIVCRRSADTFMVYCPHLDDHAAFLESIRKSVIADSDEIGNVHLRMGVYADTDKQMDMERRFDRAKMASDSVRGSFTKTVGMYDRTIHDKELYAERLMDDFSRALEEKQFVVYYQPKFDVRPEIPVLASAEALVRWIHPELGMISPGVFIPLFEENGLIQALDQYVWDRAAAQIREWRDRFGVTVPVSVNVSRIDMYDPHLIDKLAAITENNGITPAELFLEITESAYTEDSEQIIGTVNSLRDLGFRIEMDDFGTGYSSLNMISTLPIDALKLDMQFIRNAFSKKKDIRMLEVIVDIADYLSVPVIAEGVETKEQLDTLRNMGCDIVQGYYFSKPVPPEEYEKYVEESKDRLKASHKIAFPDQESLRYRRHGNTFGKIAYALSSGYDRIFYVDTVDGHYVEFASDGKYEDLQIRSSGSDFFGDAAIKVQKHVFDDDRSRVTLNLQREALTAHLMSGQPFSMTYRVMVDGNPEYRLMKAVRSSEDDDNHIVIGISDVSEHMNAAPVPGGRRAKVSTYSHIAQALARDYYRIYYVDLETDRYTEYGPDDEGHSLNETQSGGEFFRKSRDYIMNLVHPGDRDELLMSFTKEKLLDALKNNKTFTLTFRMVSGGEPLYMSLKAILLDDGEGSRLVIGVNDIDSQIRREQEYTRKLLLAREKANRDPLTGVKSKHAYLETEARMNEMISAGRPDPFSIVFLDINGLKKTNDSLGHSAGDKFIKDACTMICNVFKHSPVFRVGGDEFVVITSGSDNENMESLLNELDLKNASSRGIEGVDVAYGVAAFEPGSDRSVSDVMERADAAMYDNKRDVKEGRA